MEEYHLDLDVLTSSGLRRGGRESLTQLLIQLVDAAGGQAGAITTHFEETVSAVYGVDSESLVQHMEELVESPIGITPEGLAGLERQARTSSTGRPLAVPVRSGGRSVGVFCLWHADEAPALLHESPGLVHLNLDQPDIGMHGARLLQRLLQERQWLEAVIQHSTDGVVIHDPQGLVVGYNLTMARLSGWKPDEAVGEPGHEAFPLVLLEHSSHVFDAPHSSSVAVPGTIPWIASTEPVEAKLLARNGQSIEVEVIGAPLFDRQNQPLGWVMTVRDITRRKEMERLHKLFLSAVSHELQTPIAIIRGYAGLLADPEVASNPERVRKQSEIIVEESQRLEHMVQQMLYATRIQAGGVKLQRESLELAPFLKRLADKLKPVLKQRGVKLVLGDLPAGASVLGDQEKLQQVVTNLIENAVKYAGARPVKLSLRADGSRSLRVEVHDRGPGISAEDRERIFSPFERGGDPLKQRVRGAGLGLYICKAIVEAHGGKLGMEPNPEGGAIFYFSLPKER